MECATGERHVSSWVMICPRGHSRTFQESTTIASFWGLPQISCPAGQMRVNSWIAMGICCDEVVDLVLIRAMA